MHKTSVHLSAAMLPVTDSMLTVQADLMAQDVATALRALFDTTHASIPDANGKLTWYSVPAQIVVIVHADGSESWRAKGSDGDLTATRMLGTAFDSARARGGATLFWPEGMTADSFVVRLSLEANYQNDHPMFESPISRESQFKVFTLSEPDVTPAFPKLGQSFPRYPYANESQRIEGDVLTRFLVDSAGRVDASTIRELWPANKPRLTGYEADAHGRFVESVIRWERQLRLDPRRVGGCAVKQLAILPMKFVAPGSRYPQNTTTSPK
jgi:hypothetical protein